MRDARTIARWAVFVFLLSIAGWRLFDAGRDYQAWRDWLKIDPSGADLYETSYEIDRDEAAAAAGLGVLLFWLAKPRNR